MAKARVAAAAAVVALVALLFPVASSGFGAPAELQAGLTLPNELAVDSKGDLWFTQTAGELVTLYVQPRGTTLPVAVYDVSGDGAGTFTFITDITFDAIDAPHFVQWVADGDQIDTAVVRLEPSSLAATTLATESGTQSGFVLTAGSSIDQVEVAADGTVLFTTRTLAPTGDQVAQLHALAPGAAAPGVVAEFATAGRIEQLGDFDVARDGTVYLQEGSSPRPGAAGPGTTAVYRLAPGGSPQVIRIGFGSGVPDQPPLPSYIGLDREDNLIVGERGLTGRIRPGCATSTTFQLVRYDAASLAGPAPAGSVFSTATYPGFVWLFVGSSTTFRVGDDGDVLFGLYPGNTRCGADPGPVVFTDLWLRGVSAGDATGTQQLLIEDVPPAPVVAGYSIAVLKNDAYAASSRTGKLYGLTLKDKKPKKK